MGSRYFEPLSSSKCRCAPVGVAGRADRTERIAAQNALPGGDRYFAAMGVKRLIAVRVSDGQIFAEHGALPHHADCAVGKAGKGRALIGGKVEAV